MFKAHVKRRAVSEVVGAVLIGFIVASMSVAYVFWGGMTVSQQTSSMVDVMRRATSRQRQLLSLVHHVRSAGSLKLYICNYGTEPSAPESVFVNGQQQSYQMYDMIDQSACDAIKPKSIVQLTLPDPGSTTVDVILITRDGGIYAWQVR